MVSSRSNKWLTRRLPCKWVRNIKQSWVWSGNIEIRMEFWVLKIKEQGENQNWMKKWRKNWQIKLYCNNGQAILYKKDVIKFIKYIKSKFPDSLLPNCTILAISDIWKLIKHSTLLRMKLIWPNNGWFLSRKLANIWTPKQK